MKLTNDWKTITAYLIYHLVPIYQLTDDITFCQILIPNKRADSFSKEHRGGYYLRKYSPVKKNDKVLRLKPHEAMKIIGNEDLTCSKGPFVFHYGFEDTPEGKYVIGLIPYLFTLKPKPKKRILEILLKYSDYIELNKYAYLMMYEKYSEMYPNKSKWLIEDIDSLY